MKSAFFHSILFFGQILNNKTPPRQIAREKVDSGAQKVHPQHPQGFAQHQSGTSIETPPPCSVVETQLTISLNFFMGRK